MSRVLGLDMGTNSIGWAIIERDESTTKLVDKGVHIFQEGVNRVKGLEEPAVKTRTEARASRRHYFRRRLRKIELLKVLVEQGWCPYISPGEIAEWRTRKLFPLNPDFLEWLRTDEASKDNPYHDRHRCLNEKLDLSRIEDRYALGRAFYHINQRRGFISNRKDQSSSEEDGAVKTAIGELDADMAAAGYKYLGDYFYMLHSSGDKVRKHYTDRKEHYIKEFKAICEKQDLDQSLIQRLYDAIFFQRPLKSQKGLVGKCPFEKGKTRCALSHPDFEEFRMLSFINNIRVAYPGDIEMRPLAADEKQSIVPLFMRKSKANFDFSDISKKLAGKKSTVAYDNGRGDADINTVRFNFRDTTNVSGCPVTAQLNDLFGADWKESIGEQYVKAGKKTPRQIEDDIWHALFFFDNDDKLIQWAKANLQLSDEEAVAFSRIAVPQGYASLSLCAIRKILPWLREGYRYDEATMLANMEKVVPASQWNDEETREKACKAIQNVVLNYVPSKEIRNDSKLEQIKAELNNLGILDYDIDKLYHPSMIEVYPESQPDRNGHRLLQSPRTDSIRNPMAMRSMFRLRGLVNQLILDGKVDSDTKINIELARNLNDFNTRQAIERLQRENEKKRDGYRKAIAEYYSELGINSEPSEEEILKYELWEEQNHVCLYTGSQIPLSGFLGANPKFDIEHTVPRSRGGDDSMANKTLCERRFNRDVKQGKLPSELANADEVLVRVEATGWEKRIEDLRKDISRATRSAKAAVDKNSKDAAIQRRHVAKMQLDYLNDKMKRFKMRDVPEGFTNRQGVDIGIIGRYTRMYMKSVFGKVYTVKGETTAEFRKMWGLQDNYSKKERVNHTHHCIDAITIACIGPKEYAEWAKYKRDEENSDLYGTAKPVFPKPWETFTEDVKSISEHLLVSHYTADNMIKQTKKVLKKRGVIQRDAEGNPMYVQGDTARGSLHLQTFYGAIKKDDEVKYVVRKELSSIAEKDIKNIVDDVVREKVQKAVDGGGIGALQGNVWMNEEKGILIKKVRMYAGSVTNPIPLKQHRFASNYDYKRNYFVANESNYAMAVYEGNDTKGKVKRSFKLCSNIEAAKLIKVAGSSIFPDIDANGLNKLYELRIGTMVLFYENSRDEILKAPSFELARRLYKVTGLAISRVQQYQYGMMTFIHHQEARASTDIKYRKGVWLSSDEYRPKIELNHNQIKALVEGYDFRISATGDILFNF